MHREAPDDVKRMAIYRKHRLPEIESTVLMAHLKKHPEVYDPNGKGAGKKKEREEWYQCAWENYYQDGDENAMNRLGG